jgi:CRP-like cAMP-binding protein
MIESKFLKDNIQNIQKLMSLTPLRKFETDKLRQLIRLSKIREYGSGEVIIEEGEEDPYLYFLLKGKVGVRKEGVPISMIEKEGEIFGEMRVLDGLARSATATAEEKAVCLAVDTSATDRLGSKDERASFLLILYQVITEFISYRLRTTTDELVSAKKEIKKLSEANR